MSYPELFILVINVLCFLFLVHKIEILESRIRSHVNYLALMRQVQDDEEQETDELAAHASRIAQRQPNGHTG